MGFFDFLWGKDKKNELADASAGVAPVVFGDSDSDSDSGGVDAVNAAMFERFVRKRIQTS